MRLADSFDFRPTASGPVAALVGAADPGFVVPQTHPRLQHVPAFDGTQVGSEGFMGTQVGSEGFVDHDLFG